MAYRAVVLSTLLYTCETGTFYLWDIKYLKRSQQTKTRRILRICWKKRINNNEVFFRTSLHSVEATILQHRLGWAGHVFRMRPTRFPRIILFGEIAIGKRLHEGPKRRFKDRWLKTSLTQAINPVTWEIVAANS